MNELGYVFLILSAIVMTLLIMWKQIVRSKIKRDVVSQMRLDAAAEKLRRREAFRR